MMMQKIKFMSISLLLILLAPFGINCAPKIVGLVPIRNEADIIGTCLKALSIYTDAIVVLLDASTDNSANIVRSLQEKLKIEVIIEEKISGWQYRTEVDNRNKLLAAGRAIGGTHFIAIDADEIFSAPCAKNNWLRKQILALEKGQILHIMLVNLWKGFDKFRADELGMDPSMVYCSAIMCDDGQSNMDGKLEKSPNGFMHVGRFPSLESRKVKSGKDLCIPKADLGHILVHLAYVDWNYYLIKRAWYLCLEKVRLGQFPKNKNSITVINELYSKKRFFDPKLAILKPVKQKWLNYKFFDKNIYLKRAENWRKKELNIWFEQYGSSFFEQLDFGIDIHELLQA